MESAGNAEENAIDLNMPHPPLSPMSACTLDNEDTLKDFSDTLFISKKKHFSVPHPKKISKSELKMPRSCFTAIPRNACFLWNIVISI